MSGKNKIEKDYRNSNSKIRQMAEEEIRKIEGDAKNIKEEAEKIGAEAENSLNDCEGKAAKKKS